MHTTSRQATAAMLLTLATAAAATGAQRVATPQLLRIERANAGGAIVHMGRSPLPNTNSYVGLAAICENRHLRVVVSLGGFPADLRPVQLAVRTPSGEIERFGPVARHAGPRSAFHSPELTDASDVERFLSSALQTGALVSNGYNSFWNGLTPARNRAVQDEIRSCTRR